MLKQYTNVSFPNDNRTKSNGYNGNEYCLSDLTARIMMIKPQPPFQRPSPITLITKGKDNTTTREPLLKGKKLDNVDLLVLTS